MSLVPRPPPVTYWLTRDRDAERGLEWVVVWSVRPVKRRWGAGWSWVDPDPRGHLRGLVTTIWPLECWQRFGVLPEGAECIRVERGGPVELSPYAGAA